jgi:hypothetical protein
LSPGKAAIENDLNNKVRINKLNTLNKFMTINVKIYEMDFSGRDYGKKTGLLEDQVLSDNAGGLGDIVLRI